MKNKFLTLLMLAAGPLAFGQAAPGFMLTGKATGMDGEYVHLYYTAEGSEHHDSCLIRNGAFRFKGKVTDPTYAYLNGPGKGWDGASIWLEPKPLQAMVRNGDYKNAVLTGSATQAEWVELQRPLKKLDKQWQVVDDTLSAVNKRSNFEYQALKDWVLVPFFTQRQEITSAFYRKHPQSWVTAWYLQGEARDMPTDTLKRIYRQWPGRLQSSELGKALNEEIRRRTIGVPGTKAADFAANDIHGNRMSLGDYKGKVVLLDFWASWCLPCRKSSPHLKELLAAYKDKGLVVVGIAEDDGNENAWKKAVEKDGVDIWPNILGGMDLSKRNAGGNAWQGIPGKYGISSLPTKILVDRDGTILGRYESEETPELDQQLKELFRHPVADKPFRIDGKISGQAGGKIYLAYRGDKGLYRMDSSLVRSGAFHFEGKLSGPTMASLFTGTGRGLADDGKSTEFFIVPGNMELSVPAADLRQAVLTGSPVQSEFAGLEAAKKEVEKQYQLQLDSLRTEKDHEKAAAIRERLAPYFDAMRQKDYEFFAAHPQSWVTAFYLRFHTTDLSLDSLQHFYDGLGNTLQVSESGQELAAEIEKIRAGSPGSVAKDFTTKDLNGDDLSLSSFKGKSYVLLDFWASWCVPCRRSNPHMIELYHQYHDKGLEVIGVSDDDGKPEVWKKAVDKDGVGIWHNVLRGLDWDKIRKNESNDKDISEKFGIHSLPTKILIDKNGVIVGRYTEKDEAELDKKLAELM